MYCDKANSEHNDASLIRVKFLVQMLHPAGDVTRVSVVPRKVTVKIGDAENWWRGC